MENNLEGITNQEKKSLRYFYVDNSEGKKDNVVFQCEAISIKEADTLFEEKFGYKPEKKVNIGCIIESDVNKKWIEDYNLHNTHD